MKSLVIITLLAFACVAQASEISDLIQYVNYARDMADDQYEQQLNMYQNLAKVSDFSPKDVLDTVNGLQDAVKFWGGFIGDQVFDVAYMNKKIKELGEKREKLREYASEDGTKALVEMNQAIWDIDTSIKAIQSLAVQLKAGAKNVKMISGIALKNNVEMLDGKDKRLYEAAIKVLIKTLESGNENAGRIREKLYTIASDLNKIQSTMGAVADRLRSSAAGKSGEFKKYASEMRAKVYGGCGACVVFPAACIPCFATAAGILETNLAKYKKEIEGYVREFNSWAGTFDVLSKMAGQAKKVAEKWYHKIEDFKNVIVENLNLLTGTQDVLYMSADLRTEIDHSLDHLQQMCEKVIKDTKGRLQRDAHIVKHAKAILMMAEEQELHNDDDEDEDDKEDDNEHSHDHSNDSAAEKVHEQSKAHRDFELWVEKKQLEVMSPCIRMPGGYRKGMCYSRAGPKLGQIIRDERIKRGLCHGDDQYDDIDAQHCTQATPAKKPVQKTTPVVTPTKTPIQKTTPVVTPAVKKPVEKTSPVAAPAKNVQTIEQREREFQLWVEKKQLEVQSPCIGMPGGYRKGMCYARTGPKLDQIIHAERVKQGLCHVENDDDLDDINEGCTQYVAPVAKPVKKDPAPVVTPVKKDPAPVVTPVKKDPAPVVTPVKKDPAPVVTPVKQETLAMREREFQLWVEKKQLEVMSPCIGMPGGYRKGMCYARTGPKLDQIIHAERVKQGLCHVEDDDDLDDINEGCNQFLGGPAKKETTPVKPTTVKPTTVKPTPVKPTPVKPSPAPVDNTKQQKLDKFHKWILSAKAQILCPCIRMPGGYHKGMCFASAGPSLGMAIRGYKVKNGIPDSWDTEHDHNSDDDNEDLHCNLYNSQ